MTFRTKNEVNKFTRKLYRFLGNGHKVHIKLMTDNRGEILYELNPTHIHLDPRDELVPTLIHEALHYFHPEASEEWVLRMEKKIVSKLSERQMRNIIRRLANLI